MPDFEFILPPQIIFGCGRRFLLPEKVQELKARNTLIITSQGMMKREKPREVFEIFSNENLPFEVYSKIPPEPSLEDVEICLEFAKKQAVDLIVGIGGGSVIDVAKKLALELRAPKIILPTTSGTGSEVTHESVLKVSGKKKTFVNKRLTPDVTIVDPEFTFSMLPKLAAATGIDALAHAIECYESKKSNPLVKTLALEAFKLLKENIRKAVEGDREARVNMSLGSLAAGMAFGNSGTTLGHALSYPVSNRGVPHREAAAMVLPYALEFNGADAAFIIGVREIAKLIELRWDTSWDIQEMVREVMDDERHLANNPRKVTNKDVFKIFERIKDSFAMQ